MLLSRSCDREAGRSQSIWEVTPVDIRLIEGDALRIIPQLDTVFDAVITDPPYASGSTLSAKGQSTAQKYTETKRRCPFPDFEGDSMDQRSWTHFMSHVLGAAYAKCTDGAICVLFIDWRNLPALTDAMQWSGWVWRGTAVWDKPTSRPQKGRFRQQAEFILWGSKGRLPVDRPVPVLPGVFKCMQVSGPERIHQTQKPLDLMRELIRIVVPGGRILDPFAGSGSTLEAARLEGYSADGIEISPEIAVAARERLGV